MNEKIKPTVLIVDDEKDVRSALINFLKLRYDCKFEEAVDGEEAVNFVMSNPCDIVFLDIRMPKKSGLDVLRDVKKIKQDIDVLIVSAWVSNDVAEEAIRLGATDYILKPIDLKVLEMKFADVLNKRTHKD